MLISGYSIDVKKVKVKSSMARSLPVENLLPHNVGSIIIIIIKKKVGSARLRESDIHPISPKTPAPQYQPIDRKKRKGKRVEDYSRDRTA